nr:arogenate dehydratase/prephenate dehydratase 6, chloroplastic-like [Tanacetum cinerariifolium]
MQSLAPSSTISLKSILRAPSPLCNGARLSFTVNASSNGVNGVNNSNPSISTQPQSNFTPGGVRNRTDWQSACSILASKVVSQQPNTEKTGGPDNLAVVNGHKTLDLVPVESNLPKPLTITDLLHIVGEVQLPVHHCLLALPGIRKEFISRVISHPQALAQCELTLTKLGMNVTREAVDDTAGAAEFVAANGLRDTAAIASARAADLYNLNILADGIQDDSSNITRFVMLAREPIIPRTDRPFKTSIVFAHDKGTSVLFKVLSAFAFRNISLTKIESRPHRNRPIRLVDDANVGTAKHFEYMFYVDFEASMADVRAQNALAEVQEFTSFLRVLGSYPMDMTPEEFCLVAGLRFGVENKEEYDTQANLPFRRRVFLSHLDGQPITDIDIANAIAGPIFAELYDDDAVGLCCLGILQLVLLGAESRRNAPEWLLRIANDRVAWNKYPWGSYVWPTLYSQLRNANVRRWGPMYVDQPTNEDDPTTYSIFGYTWAFKEEMNSQPVRQENTVPINVGQHYGFSDFCQFQSMQGGLSSFKGTPSNFQTPMRSQPGSSDWQRQMPEQSASHYWQPSLQPGSYYSFGQVPSHIGRPNLQTTIETQHNVDGIVDRNILNRRKRQKLHSKYLVTPFTAQPPTTMVPKQRVSKTKNKGNKANLSPFNLGGVLEGYNEEDNNVMFFSSKFTGNILFYENVDPAK